MGIFLSLGPQPPPPTTTTGAKINRSQLVLHRSARRAARRPIAARRKGGLLELELGRPNGNFSLSLAGRERDPFARVESQGWAPSSSPSSSLLLRVSRPGVLYSYHAFEPRGSIAPSRCLIGRPQRPHSRRRPVLLVCGRYVGTANYLSEAHTCSCRHGQSLLRLAGELAGKLSGNRVLLLGRILIVVGGPHTRTQAPETASYCVWRHLVPLDWLVAGERQASLLARLSSANANVEP